MFDKGFGLGYSNFAFPSFKFGHASLKVHFHSGFLGIREAAVLDLVRFVWL